MTAVPTSAAPTAPAVPLRRVVRTFWPWAAPRVPWMLLALALATVGPLVTWAEVWLFAIVVDDVLIPQDFALFPTIALAYLGLTLVQGLLEGADRMLATFLGARFLIDLRQSLLRHLGALPLEYLTRHRLGDLLARVTGDTGAIESFLVSGTTRTLSYALELVVFTAALFWIQPTLALVSLVVAPLFWLCSRHFSRRMREVSRERQRRSGAISSSLERTLATMPLVQAFGRVDHEVERYGVEAEAKYRADMSSARLRSVYAPAVDLIELVGALSVIGLGAWMLSRGDLTVGGLLAFLALLSRLYGPVRGLGTSLTTAYTAAAGAERVIEVLAAKQLPTDRPDAVALEHCRGSVELRGVTYAYPGAATAAVVDVSFRVEPGELVAVVGASGAGKSTVARLLTRSLDPDAGSVRLDGHDLRDLTRESLRRQTSVVLQETLVHEGTVRDTIAFGRPGAGQEDIERAARGADAHAFVTALPQGYDTPVGDRGRRLSGGQARRLAIARALLRDAPLVVLDEPTSGLDVAARDRVTEPLRRLAAGRATVLVTHDLGTARLADRIVVLDHGRVGEQGTHEELLRAGGPYALLWARARATDDPVVVA